jgi:hypothetical protein
MSRRSEIKEMAKELRIKEMNILSASYITRVAPLLPYPRWDTDPHPQREALRVRATPFQRKEMTSSNK